MLYFYKTCFRFIWKIVVVKRKSKVWAHICSWAGDKFRHSLFFFFFLSYPWYKICRKIVTGSYLAVRFVSSWSMSSKAVIRILTQVLFIEGTRLNPIPQNLWKDFVLFVTLSRLHWLPSPCLPVTASVLEGVISWSPVW